MRTIKNRHLFFYLIVVIAHGLMLGMPLAAAASQTADSAALEQSGRLYLPSKDPLADVDVALAEAGDRNQRTLVVLGANWCHDSRALAARIQQEPLKLLIEKHYQTVLVDVGYLDIDPSVVNHLGPPVYYATPTVLILDPSNGRLINGQDRHQWGNADKISMQESYEYFERMAANDLLSVREDQVIAEDLQKLLLEIEDFEQALAGRLYDAYAVIGPMLKSMDEGHEDENFENYWIEVRDFRMKIPGDMESLRAEARDRIANGEVDIQLDYPGYSEFSWEPSK